MNYEEWKVEYRKTVKEVLDSVTKLADCINLIETVENVDEDEFLAESVGQMTLLNTKLTKLFG